MAYEKEPTVEAREIPSSSSSSRWPLNDDVEVGGKQEPLPLPQWPTEPQPLEQSKLSYWVGIVMDIGLILAPLLLIMKTGLVIYAYSLDIGKSGLPGQGNSISNLTLKLTEFNSQLVTLFTIIFITTVATVVRRYALYKAQIGASVTQLEQYQASISLPSTLKMVVLLRAWNWVSLLLIFIWSWYYLGSQAAQREYTYVLSTPAVDTRVGFQVSNGPSMFDNYANITSMDQKSTDGRWLSSFTTLGDEASDMEGSAIAPLLIQASDVVMLSTGEGGWLKFDDSRGLSARYSSSLGRTVWHATRKEAGSRWLGTYTATYTYLYTSCGTLQSRNASEFPNGTLPSLATSINATTRTENNFPVIDVWKRTTNLTAHTTCTIGQQSLDMKVECDGRVCAVREFRATPSESELQPATYFSDLNRTNTFFNALLLAGGVPQDLETSTIFENSIGVTIEDGQWTAAQGGVVSLAMCLSQSLSSLVNGYYTASQVDQGIFGFISIDWDEKWGLMNGTVKSEIWETGLAHGALFSPQYELNWAWIGIDLATCAVLLICAVFSFRLHKVTVAPDIFGYVSSMTRDNPNLRLPEGGSAMSGVDRARALKNIKVKLTDLNADGTAAGRIGLTRADDVAGDKRLSRTKNYL